MSRSILPDHLPFLDHIRGVAILMVFVFHCLGIAYGYDQLAWNGWWRSFEQPASFLAMLPLTFGWIGVPVFFVVSGFCIHLSHQRAPDPRISVFFAKRFFRIYPPYLAALLLFSFSPPWHYIPLTDGKDATQFFSHLFMVHAYHENTVYGINATFWSVAVESHLYLIYPLLLVFARRSGWQTALAVAAILEIGLRSYAAFSLAIESSHAPYWMTGSPVFYGFSWSIGAAAADAWLRSRPLTLAGISPWWFLTLMVMTSAFKPLAVFSFMFASLAALSINRIMLERLKSQGESHEGPLLRHLRFAGRVSYSIYLLHFPILTLVDRGLAKHLHAEAASAPMMMAACLITWIPVLAVSWLFHRFVEKPGIELGKRWIRRWLPERGAAASTFASAESGGL